MPTTLIPVDGGNPIPLRKELVLVGRQGVCDLLLEHSTISRTHCLLLQRDDFLTVRDLESTNGCRVNGQRIRESDLYNGDVLSIGRVKYRVEIRDAAALQGDGDRGVYDPHRAEGTLLSKADSSCESVNPFAIQLEPLGAAAEPIIDPLDDPSHLSDSSATPVR